MDYKEYRLKQYDDDYYLIPIELVDDYYFRIKEIEDLEEYSEDWYINIDLFNNQFSEYIAEGELFDLPLYLKETNI